MRYPVPMFTFRDADGNTLIMVEQPDGAGERQGNGAWASRTKREGDYEVHGSGRPLILGGGKRDGGWDGSGRPKSRLAILPGLMHYTIFNSPALAAAVIPFLDEDSTAG